MATPIDCSVYYINGDCHVSAKPSQKLRQSSGNNNNSGDSGSGFSVSKYLIDRSGAEIEPNSPASAANFSDDHRSIVCVVDDPTPDVARNAATNTVATGSDVRTSGRGRLQSVRSHLRRVMYRLASLLRDIKVVLFIVLLLTSHVILESNPAQYLIPLHK